MRTKIEELADALRKVGLRKGDLVMLHVSLRALGLARSQGVQHGADLLLDALDGVVGAEGTLLMVLGTDYPEDWVNQHPPDARAALLEGKPPFDFVNAPVLPEVGYFAEAFRLRPGTFVSQNPSGRFGARGARAHELLRDQPWNDYYGPGSPLQRLCDWGGRILRLGANPETVTALHYAEYRADIKNKRRTRWDYVISGEHGPKHVWIECLDDAQGIADFTHEAGTREATSANAGADESRWSGAEDDYFAEILREYLRLGRHQRGQVGAAPAELLEALDLVRFGARWMERVFGAR